MLKINYKSFFSFCFEPLRRYDNWRRNENDCKNYSIDAKMWALLPHQTVNYLLSLVAQIDNEIERTGLKFIYISLIGAGCRLWPLRRDD